MNQRRVIILFTLVLLGFVSVSIRLIDLMVLEHEQYADRAYRQHVRQETIDPRRGSIFDARMRELSVNSKVKSLYAVPREIDEPGEIAKLISPMVGINRRDLAEKLSRDKQFVWLARKLDDTVAARIEKLGLRPQLGFVNETKRTYPKGALGAHVIGFVNIDNVGAEGLERTYDSILKGHGDSKLEGRDAHGRLLSDGGQHNVNGGSLVLTLDEDLQFIVEKELADAVRKWKARAAVSIIMEPATGRILAMAVNPTYSPEHPKAPSRWRNRAITDVYEPGSTFKAIVAAAALDQSMVSPEERFDCSQGYIDVGGRRIRDSGRHGSLTFAEVLQKSSNVGIVKVAQMLGKERFFAYISRFGFGERSGVDLDGEVAGILHSPEQWSGSSIGAHAVGYEVAVTPLQMLNAYCAIANGGILMRPHIVSEIMNADGQVVRSIAPKPIRRVISREASKTLTNILETVVQEGGTAITASILGNPVAGKTGTARKYDPKTRRYSREKYMSSFVGFVPSDDPKLAIIVVLDEPKEEIYGGVVAAPVFRAIAEHSLIYLNIPRGDSGNVLLVTK